MVVLAVVAEVCSLLKASMSMLVFSTIFNDQWDTLNYWNVFSKSHDSILWTAMRGATDEAR